jgi:uncharacterized protein (TIGR02271 family)
MNLRSLMQAGPAKAVELFTKLAETPDTAVKTRERVFAELKAELEKHVELEQKYLFPVLRKQAETKELVGPAIRDNKTLRAMLNELDALPKNDEEFLPRIAELQKMFRQHARDEKRQLLPAVQRALSEDQVQDIVEKIEGSLAEADQTRQTEAEERRAAARREREEREQAELVAQHEDQGGHERHAAARDTEEAAGEVVEMTPQAAQATTETVAEGALVAARTIAEGTQRAAARALETTSEAVKHTAAAASMVPRTAFPFWDLMFGFAGAPSNREIANRGTNVSPSEARRPPRNEEEVIPLAEEVLVVGKRTVNTGSTRIRRYVIETPVQQQVSLVRERVVVERRRPATNKVTGETLTELSIEVVETDEVPVVAKSVQLREEIVVRTERIEHVETVRDTVRQDEVEIEQANTSHRARARG